MAEELNAPFLERIRYNKKVNFLARTGIAGSIFFAAVDSATTTETAPRTNQACIQEYNGFVEEQALELQQLLAELAQDPDQDLTSIEVEAQIAANQVSEEGQRPYIEQSQRNTKSATTGQDFSEFDPFWYLTAPFRYPVRQNLQLFDQIEVNLRSNGEVRINEASLNKHLEVALELLIGGHPENEVNAISWCFDEKLENNQFNNEIIDIVVPADPNNCIGSLRIIDRGEEYEACNLNGFTLILPRTLGIEVPRSLIVLVGGAKDRDISIKDTQTRVSQTALHEILGHYMHHAEHNQMSIHPDGIHVEEQWAESISDFLEENWAEHFADLPPIVEFPEDKPNKDFYIFRMIFTYLLIQKLRKARPELPA